MKRLLYFTLSFSGLLVFSLFSCTHANKQAVDELNDLSYAYHYRNLDSTYSYAQRAFLLSQGYRDGKAEALNNLAFVSLLRMDYDKAKLQLDSVSMLTDNQIEVLISDVMQMRLCQRRSHNREFYDYRADAEKTLRRINEERLSLTPRQTARLIFAESELAIVTSAYYYLSAPAASSWKERKNRLSKRKWNACCNAIGFLSSLARRSSWPTRLRPLPTIFLMRRVANDY